MMMMNPGTLNFANQNLQNRSFRGRNLIGADFSNSDIRGCDFSNALLRGANFQGVKAGQTLAHLILVVAIAVFVAIAAVHAISEMLFGILSVTPEEPAWVYTVAFFSCLGIAAVASAVRGLTGTKFIIQRIATAVSGAVSGGLLALFYRGITTMGTNPEIRVKALVISLLGMAFLGFYFPRGLVAVTIASAGLVTTYGFTFLVATATFTYLSTYNLLWGLVWSCLFVGAIAMTIISLIQLAKDITSFFTTSFRGADLTDANFEGAKLGSTDFSRAIGYRG
ncbi:MAG: pentapeptide repeat-containing protein [Fischerella sp.]|nr:pentapeptide repeat-containing protein [Fischerella sp.]